ncbi:DUF6612 family protein [Paenibacillus turicensis]|uniref:DUF6612 family protein n=1 Tax=Paenibacillus turicensis TaxID=160487 RepID=UPI003D2CA0C2
MRKWLGMLILVMLIISITACGTKEKTAQEGASTNKSGTALTGGTKNEQDSPAMNFNELIEKVKSSSYTLNSYTAVRSYEQNFVMEQGSDRQEDYMKMKSAGDYIVKPEQSHIVTELEVSGEKTTTEDYYKSGIGSYTLFEGEWSFNPPDKNYEMFSDENAKVLLMLEQLASSVGDEVKILANADQYVLTADLKGEKVLGLARYLMMMDATGTPSEEDKAQLESMFNLVNDIELKLEMIMDKQHLYLISSTSNLILHMAAGEQKMVSRFDTYLTLSKHNEIKEILVPEEAVKSVN